MKAIKTRNGFKKCPICNGILKLNFFGKATSSRDGHFTYCKKCLKERNSQRTPESRRKEHYKYKYGLSIVEYNKMMEFQKRKCLICGGSALERGGMNRSKKSDFLVVDHCHKTQKIRGLLCGKCNTVLGLMEENVVWFQTMINYIINKGEIK